jgi:serine/threonine protein phosphatase 1
MIVQIIWPNCSQVPSDMPNAHAPPDRRTYAIGDIHGSRDKLRRLLARCEQDAEGAAMAFVFLGDYIDRGEDSRGVIETLIDLQTNMGDAATFLMGNHEALALDAIDDETKAPAWLMNNAEATLRSYGVARPTDLPADHVAWLRALKFSHDDGRRFYAHAGIDPRKPLDAQDAFDLIWIREPFLSDTRDHGRLVVHGHTPVRSGQPDLRPNRLNLDTGAVYGRALTAAVFTDAQTEPVGFLQAE